MLYCISNIISPPLPLYLLSPLSLGPHQIGSQDDGDVARRHFVHLAVLSQFG